MSFYYQGKVINSNNYKEVFKGYSEDVLDEIRLAILDDTPIATFIEDCKSDSYKLGQLRMAVREYVPKEYINTCISGRTMFKIRECVRKGLDITPIRKYITSNSIGVSEETLNKLLDTLCKGGDISSVDFTLIPDSNVDIVCEGLIKNYPMSIFEGSILPAKRIKKLMRGMAFNTDVRPLLKEEWSDSQIDIIIGAVAHKTDFFALISNINEKFSADEIKEVSRCIKNKGDVKLIARKDNEGYPVYNEFQMAELNNAMINGVLTDELKNPSMSDLDMNRLISKLIEEKKQAESRVLSGTIPKKK